MSIAKILEQQKVNLEEARKTLEKPRLQASDLKFGETLKARRIEEIQARIDTLETERALVVERIDAAIAVEKKAIEELGKQFEVPTDARSGGANRPKTPAAKGKAPSRAPGKAPRRGPNRG